MTKLFETIISKFKNEVGKSKQMTAREMKLIEICYQEMVVKNCNTPAVSKSVEPVGEVTVDCDNCAHLYEDNSLYPCKICDEGYSHFKQATGC